MAKVRKLDNGLSVVIKNIKGTKAVTFLTMVPVGSRYETTGLSGASHFVEHMMFKGTEKRPTTLDISRELEAVGAQFNAFTSKDYTGYYIKINSTKSGLALDILSDILFHSKFEADEVKREKGVILEEIKMYEDNPATAAGLLLEKLIFGSHPLGLDIAGTKKSVKAMSREGLFNYYKSAYRPGNMVLVAAGDIKQNIYDDIKKYFGEKQNNYPGKKIFKNDYIKFNPNQSSKKKIDIRTKQIDQTNLLIGFPGLSYTDSRRWALPILLNILGGGMSSRLFVEVREKRGLAYKVRAGQDMFRDSGMVWIEAGLDTARLGEAVGVIKSEIKRISRVLVSDKELMDAKSNLAGQYALKMEDSSAQANFYAMKYWFLNNLDDFEKDLARIKKVTASQVRNLAKDIFKDNKMKIALVSPLNKKKISKILK